VPRRRVEAEGRVARGLHARRESHSARRGRVAVPSASSRERAARAEVAQSHSRARDSRARRVETQQEAQNAAPQVRQESLRVMPARTRKSVKRSFREVNRQTVAVDAG